MTKEMFNFDGDLLRTTAGGRSAIDIPRLNIHDLASAHAFCLSYGFDLTKPQDIEKGWYFHRRALVLLTEKLGFSIEEIPETLRDPKQLGDLGQLLIFASEHEPHLERQKWACAILRCMHVYVHAESDLFSSFSYEIQAQIITPFQQVVVNDGAAHRVYLKSHHEGKDVDLVKFEIKPFKTSTSTVIKLLARPDALAMKVFDKIGVRFVTKNLFDAFRVIRFLNEESLVSFPHIMPDQSSNNLYPVDLFLNICQNYNASDDQIEKFLMDKLREEESKGLLFRKPNEQSSGDFKFIKFITRRLIQIQQPGKESFSFFYPFEVQILDHTSYETMMSGPSVHEAYKERQKEAARKRVYSS